jgi:hypothetical protein
MGERRTRCRDGYVKSQRLDRRLCRPLVSSDAAIRPAACSSSPAHATHCGHKTRSQHHVRQDRVFAERQARITSTTLRPSAAGTPLSAAVFSARWRNTASTTRTALDRSASVPSPVVSRRQSSGLLSISAPPAACLMVASRRRFRSRRRPLLMMMLPSDVGFASRGAW